MQGDELMAKYHVKFPRVVVGSNEELKKAIFCVKSSASMSGIDDGGGSGLKFEDEDAKEEEAVELLTFFSNLYFWAEVSIFLESVSHWKLKRTIRTASHLVKNIKHLDASDPTTKEDRFVGGDKSEGQQKGSQNLEQFKEDNVQFVLHLHLSLCNPMFYFICILQTNVHQLRNEKYIL